jgi:hypothetical protein
MVSTAGVALVSAHDSCSSDFAYRTCPRHKREEKMHAKRWAAPIPVIMTFEM